MASGSKRKVQSVKRKVKAESLRFFIISLSFALCALRFALPAVAENIKEPNVAGAFYPADPDELSGMIERYMVAAKEAVVEGQPLVLISPHAGYIYSGPVAAHGFAALSGKSFDTVIILAASHFFVFKGVSVYQEGYFRTPLGDLEIDRELAEALIHHNPNLLFFEPKYFQQEHSLEVELPFLQKSLKKGFKIVPVLMGSMTYQECQELAGYLADIVKDKSILVVASTDLSHYQSYADAVSYDLKTISYIKDFDTKGLWEAVSQTGWNVCGVRPVVTSLFYAQFQGADTVEILKYANSGDTAGDKRRVVGYLSAIVAKKIENPQKEPLRQDFRAGSVKEGEADMLTRQDKKRLLEIARRTIEHYVNGKPLSDFKESSPGLNLQRGAFVTLLKNGNLRGCIGLFSSLEPLYQTVSKMAVESCAHDYRFSAVMPNEVKDLTIEISVLTEPRLIDNWQSIRLGIDGVIIRKGFSSGVFLPQVATETGWDLETFLGQLCSQKAGLPWDCFKDPATKIYTFQAEVFSESEF